MNETQGKTFGIKLGDSLNIKKFNVPGPGNYNLDSMAFSTRPRFYMGQKLTDGERSLKVPGAGTYNPDFRAVTRSLPKYSMKARIAPLGAKTTVPGPGAYENHMKHKREAPKFGFGSSTRKATN